MVRSSNMQAKAKDIDIARLTKKIQRLEKLNELNKGMIDPSGVSRIEDRSIHEQPTLEDQEEA